MLMNFAYEMLGTTVSSDKVSRDDYECSNLISKNPTARRNGFMAEHFIKPPVNVTLSFPCRVNLSQVVMTPTVGQQQSIQLEVFTASSPGNASHGQPNQSAIAPPLFFSVSKLTTSDSSRICFYNPYHRSTAGNNQVSPPSSFQSCAVMRTSRKNNLYAATHLCIRIHKTRSGSTPCLCSLDVWGSPSPTIPLALKNSIIASYSNLQHSLTPPSEINGQRSLGKSQEPVLSPSTSANATPVSQEELDIPEEFIDPITCEVMTVPMLLPSGKIVDKLTLDKFNGSEASFGRLPRDPFTGVEFSESLRPLPNAALKLRIDRFLLKHSGHASLSCVGRTVGRRMESSSSLLGKRSSSHPMQQSTSSYTTEYSVSSVLKKKSTLKDPRFESGLSGSSLQILPQSSIAVSNTSQNASMPTTPFRPSVSHEAQLKSSLDGALQSVLSSLSAQTELSTQQSQAPNHVCSKCKEKLTDSSVTYQTPCHHLLCRKCIMNLSNECTEMSCDICRSIFLKSKLVRRHLTHI